MNKNIRVLQVLPSLKSGGAELVALDIAGYVKEQGCESFVASAGGSMTESLYKKDIIHFKLALDTKNPVKIWLNSSKISKICKKYKINILHVHSRAPAWSCYLAARQLNKKNINVKLVTHWHGAYSLGGKLKNTYNQIMASGDKVIAVSNFIKSYILDNYPKLQEKKKDIEVIYPGINGDAYENKNIAGQRIIEMSKYLGIESDLPIILMVARFSPNKGHNWLIESLNLLKQNYKEDFYCLMVGKIGDKIQYFKNLQKLLDKYGLKRHVRMLDSVTDMPALYKLADLVVCPSIKPEAFGRVPAEAAAENKICIAANHGGAAEIILDKETGFLVKVGDSLELANKIEEVLTSSAKSKSKIIKAAHERTYNNFINQITNEQIIKLYKKLVK